MKHCKIQLICTLLSYYPDRNEYHISIFYIHVLCIFLFMLYYSRIQCCIDMTIDKEYLSEEIPAPKEI